MFVKAAVLQALKSVGDPALPFIGCAWQLVACCLQVQGNSWCMFAVRYEQYRNGRCVVWAGKQYMGWFVENREQMCTDRMALMVL